MKILSLTIEFITNIQIIAISNNEAIIEAIKEVKTVIIVVIVRVVFMFVEKHGRKVYSALKERKRKNDN